MRSPTLQSATFTQPADTPTYLGTVAALWRYPVKSMRGERLSTASFDASGMRGDRRFAFASTAAPPGKPLLASRERTAMLRYAPQLDPRPQVTAPDGRCYPLPSPELLALLEAELAAPGAKLDLRTSPARPLTDVRPVSLIFDETLRGLNFELGRKLDPQRFRTNLVLRLDPAHAAAFRDEPKAWPSPSTHAFVEDMLTGVLHFGDSAGLTLRLGELIPRCRIVSLDPTSLETDAELLRHLARYHRGRLGVYASVLRRGIVRTGDPVWLARAPTRLPPVASARADVISSKA